MLNFSFRKFKNVMNFENKVGNFELSTEMTYIIA